MKLWVVPSLDACGLREPGCWVWLSQGEGWGDAAFGGKGGGFILGDPTLTLGTKRTKILNFRDLRDLTLP